MPNKKLLQQKLAEIMNQLRNLKELIKLNQEELFGNERNFYFAERVMERLIGAAIDINMHLVADIAMKVPEDYFQSFIILGRLKILPKQFAVKIAPSTTLRNILAHEYQKIDLDKFRQALKRGFTDYKKYAYYIQRYLDRF